MKAVYLEEPGGPEAMIYGDRPDPEVAPGEVMLRVYGSALNRGDIDRRIQGRSGRGPRIGGMDAAGEVVYISPDADTTLKVGDRVLLENRIKCRVCENCVAGLDQYCSSQKRIAIDLDGGHAEYLAVPPVCAFKIPDSMSFTEAAAISQAGHTAWQCMIVQAQVRPWDDVLVHAAGSGVASMGIQIAKMVGARVFATAGSDWKLEEAKKWGVAEGINYRETPKVSERIKELTGGKGVDLVFDVVGADVWEDSLLCLKPGGRMVITGTTSGSRTSMDLSVLQGRPLHLMGSGGRTHRSFGDMMKCVNNGELRGIVGQTFPLEGVPEAHRVMESREFFGKLVIES